MVIFLSTVLNSCYKIMKLYNKTNTGSFNKRVSAIDCRQHIINMESLENKRPQRVNILIAFSFIDCDRFMLFYSK